MCPTRSLVRSDGAPGSRTSVAVASLWVAFFCLVGTITLPVYVRRGWVGVDSWAKSDQWVGRGDS
jgi:hypothetical protein